MNPIIDHMIEAVKRTAISEEPCVYLYMHTFFPPLFYMDLMKAMPNMAAYKPLGPRDSREDGTSTRDFIALDSTYETPTPWRMVYNALTSKSFRDCLMVAFAQELSARLERPAEAVPNYQIKGLDVRLMRDTVDYRLAPHTDSASKIITLQAYLPLSKANEDYGTSFYKQDKGTRTFTEVTRLGFLPNTAYTFPIVREDAPPPAKPSWHGREKLDRASVIRNSIIYNIYR